LARVHGIAPSLVQFKVMGASWSGKHPLSGSRNWFNFQRSSINNSFMVVEPLCSKKEKLRKINLLARGAAALDQQKTTSSNKEFGSEIKLRDGCIHLYQQLEKMVWRISKIE